MQARQREEDCADIWQKKSDTGFITHVYVTTEYGKEIILELSENIYKEKLHIHVGRLDEEAMQKELAYIKTGYCYRCNTSICQSSNTQYKRCM